MSFDQVTSKDKLNNVMEQMMQDTFKRYQMINFISSWITLVGAYVLFFFGYPIYMWAAGISAFNIVACLIFTSVIANTKGPSNSSKVKWDPKKKNDVRPK